VRRRLRRGETVHRVSHASINFIVPAGATVST
jgi:hypothetical protein